jgi:hypothetical protein
MPDLDCGAFPPLLFLMFGFLRPLPNAAGKNKQKKQKRRKSAAVQNAAVIDLTSRPKWVGLFLPVAKG